MSFAATPSRHASRDGLHVGDARDEKVRAARYSAALDRYTNDITFTVHRLDDARAPRIVAQYVSQAADAHVDAAIAGIAVAAARQLDELQARDHAVAMRQQRRQHAKLGVAHRGEPLLGIAQLARHAVQLPAGEM